MVAIELQEFELHLLVVRFAASYLFSYIYSPWSPRLRAAEEIISQSR